MSVKSFLKVEKRKLTQKTYTFVTLLRNSSVSRGKSSVKEIGKRLGPQYHLPQI